MEKVIETSQERYIQKNNSEMYNQMEDINSTLNTVEDMHFGHTKVIHELLNSSNDKVKDDVYKNKSIVGSYYSVTTTEGDAIVDKLQADSEDYVSDWKANKNLVSEDSDNLYWIDFADISSTFKTRFGLEYDSYSHYYELEFSKSNNDVRIKAYIPLEEMKKKHSRFADWMISNLPIISQKFGVTYNTSGEMDSKIDMVFTYDQEYCDGWRIQKGLDQPYDTDISSKIIHWIATFDTQKQKFTEVKAHKRNYL